LPDKPLILLHLSDPHFGPKSHWDKPDPAETALIYLDEIQQALRSFALMSPKGFDAIVLSGDCTWGPAAYIADPDHRRGFDIMRQFLSRLVPDWIPAEQNILIVPGNHDVLWGAVDPRTSQRVFLTRSEAEARYRNMLKQAFPSDVRRVNPHLSWPATVRKDGHAYILFGLNSTRIEHPEVAGVGYVGYDQLCRLSLDAQELDGPSTLVVILHHHLNALSTGLETLAESSGARPSFVVDSDSLLETLNQAGTAAVLHGHLHEKKGWSYSLPPLLPTAVCGAGSIGICVGSKQIFAPHQFQVLEIWPKEVICHSLTAKLQPQGKDRTWEYECCRFENRGHADRPSAHLTRLCDDMKERRSRVALMLFESCLLYDAVQREAPQGKKQLSLRVRPLYERKYGAIDAAFEVNFENALSRLFADYPPGRSLELHRRFFSEETPLWVLLWREYFPKSS